MAQEGEVVSALRSGRGVRRRLPTPPWETAWVTLPDFRERGLSADFLHLRFLPLVPKSPLEHPCRELSTGQRRPPPSFVPMPKYRLVIFDSDGTLADTLPWMRSVFNEIADAHGFGEWSRTSMNCIGPVRPMNCRRRWGCRFGNCRAWRMRCVRGWRRIRGVCAVSGHRGRAARPFRARSAPGDRQLELTRQRRTCSRSGPCRLDRSL